MMNKPTEPDHGAAFDLDAIAKELRGADAYREGGQAARTLIRTPDLRILLLALAAGKTISEHHASATVSVQTLSGQVRLQLPERRVQLAAHELLVLGLGLSHDVYAETDSVFLLTLGKPAVTDA